MSQQPLKEIRLLIVDDHEVVRLGLQTVFKQVPHLGVVGEAGSVAQAIAQAELLKPDVVLLDVRLPDGQGFDACKAIKETCPDTRVLILTSIADDQIVINAIDAGADGFLLKEINGDTLIQSVEAIANGQSILDPSTTRRILRMVKSGSDTPSENKLDLLSAQERRVLALVSEGKTNKEIAADLVLSEKTVKNYLSNLMEKLQMSRRSQAAAYYVQHLGTQ